MELGGAAHQEDQVIWVQLSVEPACSPLGPCGDADVCCAPAIKFNGDPERLQGEVHQKGAQARLVGPEQRLAVDSEWPE